MSIRRLVPGERPDQRHCREGVKTMRKLIPVAIGLPLIAGAVILAVSNLHAAVQSKPVGAKAADCCPAASTSAKAAPASADDCCDDGSCCH